MRNRRMVNRDTLNINQSELSTPEIIALAWDRSISLETIQSKTRLTESEIIMLVRTHMQPSSYRRWRRHRAQS